MLQLILKMLPFIWPTIREMVLGIKEHPGIRGKPKSSRLLIAALVVVVGFETDYIVNDFKDDKTLAETTKKELQTAKENNSCKELSALNETLSDLQYRLHVEKQQHDQTKLTLAEMMSRKDTAVSCHLPVIESVTIPKKKSSLSEEAQRRLDLMKGNN